jgi:protein arginine kinase activator
MLCELCPDHDASVFFTQIINGQVKKVNLCAACSKKKGVTDSTSFALAELLLGLGKEVPSTGGVPALEDEAEAEDSDPPARSGAGGLGCPVCGFTQHDFKKAGRLGCAACYGTFRVEIDNLLKTIHKGVRHVGKVPTQAAVTASMAHGRLEDLRRDLNRAVGEENFEEAARLRDEINHLMAKSV